MDRLTDDLKAVTRIMHWVDRCSPEARKYVRDMISNRVARDAEASVMGLLEEAAE
jgi:hypothetical protein